MTSNLLLALGLIPSMLFVYLVLTTLYGADRAYCAISWVPLAYSIVVWIFRLQLEFQHLSDEAWRDLADIIAWASLVQASLGVGLLMRSLYNRKGMIMIILLLASLASAAPFLVSFVR